jgi:hypothetical protein
LSELNQARQPADIGKCNTHGLTSTNPMRFEKGLPFGCKRDAAKKNCQTKDLSLPGTNSDFASGES